MSYRSVCRDCPIPGCGAKYLVKLSNHLADVHGLSSDDRKDWLQESELQPVVKVVRYNIDNGRNEEKDADQTVHVRTGDISNQPKRKRES